MKERGRVAMSIPTAHRNRWTVKPSQAEMRAEAMRCPPALPVFFTRGSDSESPADDVPHVVVTGHASSRPGPISSLSSAQSRAWHQDQLGLQRRCVSQCSAKAKAHIGQHAAHFFFRKPGHHQPTQCHGIRTDGAHPGKQAWSHLVQIDRCCPHRGPRCRALVNGPGDAPGYPRFGISS